MRNIILTTGLLLLGLNLTKAQSDELKPFRVEVGGGLGGMYGGYWGNALYSGGSFYIEPKYQVTDKWALGALIEGGFFGSSGYDGFYFINYCPRLLITGDYYYDKNHKNNKTMHFVGMGLGATLVSGTDGHFILRTGYEKSRFRLTASIGFTGNTREPYLYFGISLGYVFHSKKK